MEITVGVAAGFEGKVVVVVVVQVDAGARGGGPYWARGFGMIKKTATVQRKDSTPAKARANIVGGVQAEEPSNGRVERSSGENGGLESYSVRDLRCFVNF